MRTCGWLTRISHQGDHTHVISRKALVAFAADHADAVGPLDAWYRIAKAHSWKSLVEIQAVLPYTEGVSEFTVFNIKGNTYRLITWIKYARVLDDGTRKDGTIFVREVLTHADYDKGKWK